MRILHVLGKLDRGGAETWLVQVLRHIDRSKYQFDFLVHTEEPGAYDDEVRALGARVIPCLKPSNPVQYARNFLRVLKEYGPYDCVHSHVHHFSGYVMALAKLGGVEGRIAHSHTSHHEADASTTRRIYLNFMRWLIQTQSTKGIAVSKEAAASLFLEGSAQNWVIQPLGIDLDCYHQRVDRDAIRQSLGLAKSAFVVGHVGRFVEAKNHKFFVEIAAEVSRLRPESYFLLVGDGPLRGEIEHLVAERGLTGRIIFAGLRTDVPALLGCMDVFLFPSLYEGFPLALVEAQAAHLRSVVSEAISTEVDIVPGLIYWLSLAETPAKWAEKLLGLKALRTGSSPRKFLNDHTIDAAVSRLCSAYDAR